MYILLAEATNVTQALDQVNEIAQVTIPLAIGVLMTALFFRLIRRTV